MKRLMKVFVVLIVMMAFFASSAFGLEVIEPTKNHKGQVGTSSRVWNYGYFDYLNLYGTTANKFLLTGTPTADRTVTFPNRSGQVQIAGASSALTPGAAVALTVGLSNVYTDLVTDNQDQTITFSGAGTAGDEITIIFTTAGTGDEVITFHATLVSSVGTLTLGTDAGKYYVVRFISNGTHWFEVSRTAVQ